MPRKIVIDAFQYSSSVTGTDRMAHNFLKELQKLDTSNTYYILCSRKPYVQSSIYARNFKIIKPFFLSSLPYIGKYFNYIWRRLSKIWLLKIKADIYYSFHNMQLPGRRLAKKMVASNLDLIPIQLEEYKNLGRTTYKDQLREFQRVADMADIFMSISNYSKQELCTTLNVDKAKVAVIHLAADPIFNKSDYISNEDTNAYGKFIFTLGGSEPRKKVNTVVHAYNLLPEDLRKEYKLVIAGGKWHHKPLEKLILNENIIAVGYVPDAELPKLYNQSSCFVFASEYEGFGFAILEAMASGTPVVNAHGSSLDEVAGKATLVFDPNNEKELAEKLTSLLGDSRLQKDLIQRGYKQSEKFSWNKAGRQLHKILTED